MDDMRQSAHSTPVLLGSRKAALWPTRNASDGDCALRVVGPDAWPASCVRAQGSEVVRALTTFSISSERI